MNRTFTKGLTVIFSCAILAIFMNGCQESDQSEIRRAKLVGNENIQLKKQLESKDKEIQKQKDLVTKIEVEKALAIEQSAEANLKLLKALAEVSKEKDTLLEENLRLKAQIKELQSKDATKQ